MAQPVRESPGLPTPFNPNSEGLFRWTSAIISTLQSLFFEYGFRLNRSYIKDGSENADMMSLSSQSSDPDDPSDGSMVIWLSDGTGSGDDGDVMVKITDTLGTTKTTTLIDFSGLP